MGKNVPTKKKKKPQKALLINTNKTQSCKNLTNPPKMTTEMVESVWANMGYFLHHLDPNIREIRKKQKRLHLKILKMKQSMVFYWKRLDNDLLPKYIYI